MVGKLPEGRRAVKLEVLALVGQHASAAMHVEAGMRPAAQTIPPATGRRFWMTRSSSCGGSGSSRRADSKRATDEHR